MSLGNAETGSVIGYGARVFGIGGGVYEVAP